MPKFSIIIPTYNSADYIHIPLESLRNQTYQNFEVLIINDGSTDTTANVAMRECSGIENCRVISKPNGHWGSCINYVLNKKLATGDYITIINSDDSFDKKCLELVSKHQGDIIATDINSVKRKGRDHIRVMHGGKGEKNLSRIFTPFSSPHGKFYSKNLFYKSNDVVEGVPYQDGLLYNLLASRAKSFYWIKKPLVTWGHQDDINFEVDEWNIDKVKYWLQMCERALAKSIHYETTSWVIMKLKELAEHYHGQVPFRISLNKKKAKFLWMPFGRRKIAKMRALFRTRRFRK